MLPLVSVIIPTYNRKDLLLKAIDSVLNQSYENIEIIVVDDNSELIEVRRWVETKLNKKPQIKLVQNNSNLGGALSRNEGIKIAEGKFIAFLDDDDIYYKDKIKKQYKKFQQKKDNNVGLIHCFTKGVTQNGKLVEIYKNEHHDLPIFESMLGNIAGTSLWFMPKIVFQEVGMFEDSPSKQDSILILKILSKGFTIYYVPEVLVEYTEDNIDNKISGMGIKNIEGIQNYRKWCRKNYNFINSEERKNVEYNFSKQLMELYLINNYKKEAYQELKNMTTIFPFAKSMVISIGKFIFPTIYKKSLLKKQGKRLQ